MVDVASHWIDDSDSLGRVRELAAELGCPVPSRQGGPVCEELQPLPAEQARPRSISAKSGKGEQELHTDGAYHRTPPAYLLLYCVSEGSVPTPTLVVPVERIGLEPDALALMRSGRWSINGGRGSKFYRPALESDGGIRYDPYCMIPANADAVRVQPVLSAAVRAAKPVSVVLRRGQTLVIANRLALHSRSRVETSAFGRVMCRVLVRRLEFT